MTGWDTWMAVPIDWRLMAVCPSVHDRGEAFVYSENLWATHRCPELWVSGLGMCGHRVSVDGAAQVLNDMARRMIAGDLKPGGEHAVPFDSGAVLRFELRLPSRDRWKELQAYYAEEKAPICEVRWTCCAVAEAAASAR